MQKTIRFFGAVVATFALSGVAAAQCPDCPVKGGGDAATDCHAELASDAVRLNSPFYNPAKPKPGKEIRCFDGDPGCDLDGVANNSCTFDVDLCLHNADTSLPSCTPATVTAVTIDGKTDDFPGLTGLQAAVNGLVPASTNVCTTGQSVTVALKGPSSKGEYKATKFSFKVSATAGAIDADQYRFVCVPRGWPTHGYDANNTRRTPLDTNIDSTNVSTLVQKWRFNIPGGASGDPITSTVTVGAKLVYTSGWDGRVYALSKKSGAEKWAFNTAALPPGTAKGIQSSVTLTPDGRVLVGDSKGKIWCLDGKKGTVLWSANAGADDPSAAHAWASPAIANNRVLMGIASHNDAPCVRGTLVAYDLDTGVKLWQQYTVPEDICYADTSIQCSANADCGPGPEAAGSPCLLSKCDSNPDQTCGGMLPACPLTFLNPGTCVGTPSVGECWLNRSITCSSDADCPACVPGVGGGVTATPAFSPDGNDVYMASVGCLSRPSIGNSDSIFKLDAATGAIDWVYRTEATEQFEHFPIGQGPSYHDYGFLNGPILANVSDGAMGTVPVAVGGGKDGTIYAVNQSTGLLRWSNVLAAAPSFAGFGLFNGALAYDEQTDQFFADLYDINTYSLTNNHMLSFKGVDGTIGWQKLPGGGETSWSSLTIANDLVFTGHIADSTFYAFKKADGTLAHTFPPPTGLTGATVAGGAAVENGVLYVPYGNIFGGPGTQGAVIAYTLPAP
jgi:outer membrane protein assembly factor BamB